MATTLERYHEAASRLDALIDMTPTPADTSRTAIQARAVERMERLRRFLRRLGDPHVGYPIIHIGGTSGKGSTSTALAAILTEAGYHTGLHTSPYLQTPAEKLQLDGALIAPERFIALADEILAEHDRWLADGEPPLTYGEAWNALTWLFLSREQVDVAVVEVGAGGRFDLTNILSPTLSIITSVGIDHVQTLGPTIEQIAWHKAGIIKPGIPALSVVPDPVARRVIAEEAAHVRAPLTQIDLSARIAAVCTGPDGTRWHDGPTGRTWRTAMPGSFQARNGAAALAAAHLLRTRGFTIPDDAIARGLLRARIPGRAELVPDRVPVLLDGAHNAEKIAALAADVPALLPRRPGARRIGVVGVLDAKQGDEMLRSIVPVLDFLIATAPRVLAKEPRDAGRLAESAREAGFDGEIAIEPEPMQAIARAMAAADAAAGDAVLVTGSLYLVGNVRERWYPEAAIVEAQSPWPTARVGAHVGRTPDGTAP